MIVDLQRAESDAAYREDMRHRCITDHFFLAEVMGLRPFNELIHRPVANLYFPKNPNLPITEQHPIKNRIHLDPRDSWKTTFGRVDSLQWILAFPKECTILNATATQPLGKAISQVIANYFYQAPRSEPTAIHILYPELLTRKEPFKGNDVEKWKTKTHDPQDIDATIAYTSPLSTMSGWHPYILNPDDMVDTKNSGIRASNDVRQGVISTYNTNKNAVRNGGYINFRGTRYHPFELYGETLKDIDLSNPEESGWKLLIRSAVVLKNKKRIEPDEFPAREDVELPFEDLGITYEVARKKWHEDYETFMCQQQNDPLGGNVPIFTEQMFNASQLPPERIPAYRNTETFICWRLPYARKANTVTEAEGATVRILDGRVYVIDCWRGNYIPSRLAERIVQEQKNHHATGVMIFSTPGSESMWPLIRNEAAKKNMQIPLRWTEWESSDELRNAQIKQMEPLMKAGRIWFNTLMTKGADCRKQFVHFGLVEDNGIIECISQLTNQVPLSQMRANMEEEELEYQRRAREQAQVGHWLEQQGMAQVDEQAQRKARAQMVAMSRVNTWTIPPLPGGLDG